MFLRQGSDYLFTVFMADVTDGKTPLTGLTLTIFIKKAGEAFVETAFTVTDRGRGVYEFTLTAAQLDTLGDFWVVAEGSGAESARVKCQVLPDYMFTGAT